MSDLIIQNLSVSLSGKAIFDRLNLVFPAGQLIGLIGPNGAGKSTLLRACLKLVISTGSVSLQGKDLLDLNAEQRSRYLSFLPQERELAWALTVESVVRLGLPSRPIIGLNKRSHDDQSIDDALELLELTDIRKRQASDLSGGELARVLIARLIVQDTPIIMADEPLAGLDPQQQIKVMNLFKSLALSGKTVIASIHDLSQAALWCDELILIDQGKFIAQGKPLDVLTAKQLAETYRIEADLRLASGKLLILPIGTL